MKEIGKIVTKNCVRRNETEIFKKKRNIFLLSVFMLEKKTITVTLS